MQNQTLTELQDSLRQKKLSSVELTRYYLDRINTLDNQINSFITVTEQVALQQAEAADKLLARNSNAIPALCGIPIAHKDIICTQGIKTSCASKMLDTFVSPYNATIIDNFNKAGAVMLGKTNMDEFAMGSSNETSFYGACRNPWNLDTVPGGSSGGSAAAVAADFSPAASGTDTGGSIRQPASFCGLTGLKPTYGAVSRYGIVAYASSLDQAGPLARNAKDAALLLNVMAGFDPRDSTSIQRPDENYLSKLDHPLKGKCIGLPEEYFNEALDHTIAKSLEDAISLLKKQGVTFKSVNLTTSDSAISAYYIIAPSEASANLQRYDGVRYGYRCKNPSDLEDLYKRTRQEGFGDEVKRRLLVGTYALSAGFYDAYYRQAQKIRRLIKNDFERAFAEVDFILGPTTPTTAFKLGANEKDPVSMYLEDIFTISVNLAGLPAISIPCGLHQGLPIGMQIIGKPFAEADILNLAHQYQQLTDWHKQQANFAI